MPKPEIPKRKLKIVPLPGIGVTAVNVPPALSAGSNTIDYTCGHCGTVLLEADTGQVFNLVIRCVKCGSYNSTDA